MHLAILVPLNETQADDIGDKGDYAYSNHQNRNRLAADKHAAYDIYQDQETQGSLKPAAEQGSPGLVFS